MAAVRFPVVEEEEAEIGEWTEEREPQNGRGHEKQFLLLRGWQFDAAHALTLRCDDRRNVALRGPEVGRGVNTTVLEGRVISDQIGHKPER